MPKNFVTMATKISICSQSFCPMLKVFVVSCFEAALQQLVAFQILGISHERFHAPITVMLYFWDSLKNLIDC